MTVTTKMLLTASGLNPLDGLADVVTQIETRVVASDGTQTADVFESVPMRAPDPENFKPINDCTPTDYLAWVMAAKGDGYAAWKADMEARAVVKLVAPSPFTRPAVEAPSE